MKLNFQTRCIILCSILVVGLSVLSARLVQIQLVDRQMYAKSSRKAFHRVEKIAAGRGMIVDCRDEPLAKSIPVATVFVDKNHKLFSSAHGIALGPRIDAIPDPEEMRFANFISMDPPRHDLQRLGEWSGCLQLFELFGTHCLRNNNVR